ncbi:MAG: bifunctional adenosylcobinamide kinase/adenosylcobinamide-phosphate guanylyltransferase, partial [Candidatus Acidiferrales bacterium]
DKDLVAVEQVATEEAAKLANASQLGNIIAVTNEVGSGIVPGSSVARQFRDIQGLVNQKLALASESVYFLVSGIPMRIKPGVGVVQ